MKKQAQQQIPITPPRKPPELMTAEDDALEAKREWRRRLRESKLGLEKRAAVALAEVQGKSFCVTKEVCACGTHYKICVKNGGKSGPPLCPITVAIRKARIDVREGRPTDCNLVGKLLERAAIQSG